MFKKSLLSNKIISLVMVIFLCTNATAAIVSDNDGSAFTTKTEFEALKKNFQSQIENYNESIDGKIDGAIAAYLAGINLEVAQTLKTVLPDWEDITMRNYEIKNVYGIPETNIIYSYYASGHTSANFNRWPSSYGLACVGQGTGGKTQIKAVALRNKEGKEEYYNDTTKNEFYWDGYITDYEEKIAMSKLGYNNNQDVNQAFSSIRLKLFDVVKLSTIDNSYFSSIKDFWNTKWKPLPQGSWTGDGTMTANWNPTYSGGFFTWGTTYDTANKKYLYELTWHDLDENIINPSWMKCFYKFTDNTIKSDKIVGSMSLKTSGTWLKLTGQNGAIPSYSNWNSRGGWSGSQGSAWEKTYVESHYRPNSLSASIYDWTRGSTSGGKYDVPTIGGLGPIKSSKIFIQKDDFKYSFKNKDYKKTTTKMSDGFPLIYATKDSKLTWECSFKDIEGSTAVKNNGEVKIILSYGEFGDEAQSSGGYVQSDGSKGSEEYAFTTNKKTCRITWLMAEDGWIYAKWFPAALTSDTAKAADKWSITLIGPNSNKISYVDKS